MIVEVIFIVNFLKYLMSLNAIRLTIIHSLKFRFFKTFILLEFRYDTCLTKHELLLVSVNL